MDFTEFLEKYKIEMFHGSMYDPFNALGIKALTPVFNFEVEVMNHIHYNGTSSIVKSRQMGLTTLYFLYMFWFLKYGDYYTPKKNIIYVTDNIHDAARLLSILKNIIHIEEATYNISTYTTLNNSCSIQYRGKEIIINQINDFISNNKFRGFNDIELIIFDDIEFNRYSIEFNNLFNFFYGNTVKISFGVSPKPQYRLEPIIGINNTMATLYFDTFAVNANNYNLHYSKSPLWTYERLISNLYSYSYPQNNNSMWLLEMECKFKVDNNNNEPIILKPYKDKFVLNVEKELNILLNENIHE